MHSSNWYGYGEIQGKMARLSYSLGIGVSRQYLDEDQRGYEYYTFRPRLSLSYSFMPGTFLRYNFQVTPYLPSLASINNIRQQQSNNEFRVGNPDLTPYRSYGNSLMLNSRFGFVDVQLTGGYNFSRNPIMAEVNRVETEEGYIFEYTSANQKKNSRLYGRMDLRMKLIPDILQVRFFGGVSHFRNTGNHYVHTYTAWNGGGQINLTLGKFSLGSTVQTGVNTLSGETIYYGDSYSVIEGAYSWKNFQFGAGYYYPFVSHGWKSGSKLLSEWVQKSEQAYIRDNGNMLTLNISYKFAAGKSHKAGRKTIHHTDRESGVVK